MRFFVDALAPVLLLLAQFTSVSARIDWNLIRREVTTTAVANQNSTILTADGATNGSTSTSSTTGESDNCYEDDGNMHHPSPINSTLSEGASLSAITTSLNDTINANGDDCNDEDNSNSVSSGSNSTSPSNSTSISGDSGSEISGDSTTGSGDDEDDCDPADEESDSEASANSTATVTSAITDPTPTPVTTSLTGAALLAAETNSVTLVAINDPTADAAGNPTATATASSTDSVTNDGSCGSVSP